MEVKTKMNQDCWKRDILLSCARGESAAASNAKRENICKYYSDSRGPRFVINAFLATCAHFGGWSAERKTVYTFLLCFGIHGGHFLANRRLKTAT